MKIQSLNMVSNVYHNPYSAKKRSAENKEVGTRNVSNLNAFAPYYLVNFKGAKESSYNQLQKSLKNANYDLSRNGQDLRRVCTEENVIGSGRNSLVYHFPEDEMKGYVLKLIVRANDFEQSFDSPIREEKDIFAGLKKGQVIARVGNHIEIMHYIAGEPHSVPDWSSRRDILTEKPITPKEASDFLDSIIKISHFPQESFDKYAKELKDLADMNYKADSFNPNNYLIDYDNQEIHIIDAYTYLNDGRMNTKFDLLCPLIDYPNFENYYNAMTDEQKEQYISTTKLLAKKCSIAALKNGINVSESMFKDFIAMVDGRYNFDVYTKSFQKVKQICGTL